MSMDTDHDTYFYKKQRQPQTSENSQMDIENNIDIIKNNLESPSLSVELNFHGDFDNKQTEDDHQRDNPASEALSQDGDEVELGGKYDKGVIFKEMDFGRGRLLREDQRKEPDVAAALAKVMQCLTELQMKREAKTQVAAEAEVTGGWVGGAREAERRAELAEGGARAAAAAVRRLIHERQEAATQAASCQPRLEAALHEVKVLQAQVRSLRAAEEAHARPAAQHEARAATHAAQRRASLAALGRVDTAMADLAARQKSLEGVLRKLQEEMSAASSLHDRQREEFHLRDAREQTLRQRLAAAARQIAQLQVEVGRGRARAEPRPGASSPRPRSPLLAASGVRASP